MSTIRVLLSRVLDLVLRRRRDQRLTEEVEAHLDLLSQDYAARGLSPAAARQAARRAFGGVDQMRAAYRDQRGLPFLDALGQDVRFAGRLLRRDRGFAITAVLVLGLGIGINNMLFTILNAHTLRGLPIAGAGRVVAIASVDDRGPSCCVSYLDFADWRTAAHSLADLAAFSNAPVVVSEKDRLPERFDGAFVSGNAFATIGVQPVLGRAFRTEDDRPGAPAVVMLGAGVWQSRYGGDREILGRAVMVERRTGDGHRRHERPLRVSQHRADLAAALADAGPRRAASRCPLAPRVRTAARRTVAAGRACRARGHRHGSGAAASGHEREDPRARGPDRRAVFRPRHRHGLAGVHGDGRHHRLDLLRERGEPDAGTGAPPGPRDRDQKLARREPRADCPAAAHRRRASWPFWRGPSGSGWRWACVRVFGSAIPRDALPYWIDYSPDVLVVSVLIGVSAATVLFFALLPAIHVSRTDVNAVLKDSGRPGTGRGGRRWTTGFLAAEFALAVVFLAQFAVQLRNAGPDLPSDAAIDTTGGADGRHHAAAGPIRHAGAARSVLPRAARTPERSAGRVLDVHGGEPASDGRGGARGRRCRPARPRRRIAAGDSHRRRRTRLLPDARPHACARA